MIPVSAPLITERDRAHVEDCLRRGWVAGGPFVEEFEQRWAAYCGRRHGVAVSSGTSALALSIAGLDLAPGDEVIMPAFTIISCALAVVERGGVPVLVDSDPDSFCMAVAEVEARITSRTRAIMPVHIYGHPVSMDALLELAERRGLAIIEDAAEAHGAEHRSSSGAWRRCGSFGAMSCFSFYANKLVTTGEGGMVLTDDPRTADRLRALGNLSHSSARRFRHEELGLNVRLGAMQAALGSSQVERMDEIVRRKRWIAAQYRDRLGDLSGVTLVREQPWARSVYWVNALVLSDDRSMDAAALGAALAREGVETRPFFVAMHQQPALLARGLFAAAAYPVAERISARGLYLPSGLGLTERELSQVCEAVRRVIR